MMPGTSPGVTTENSAEYAPFPPERDNLAQLLLLFGVQNVVKPGRSHHVDHHRGAGLRA